MTKNTSMLSELVASPKSVFPRLWNTDSMVKAVEMNDWHVHQDVLSHTYMVVDAVQRIGVLKINCLDLLRPYITAVEAYMADVPIGSHTRGALLITAALFHDVGKPMTLKRNSNGETTCPNHARIGADLIRRRGLRVTDLNPGEFEYVLTIIRHHHDADTFLDPQVPQSSSEAAERFALTHGKIAVDLLFFYIADTEGCLMSPNINALKPTIYATATAMILKEGQHHGWIR